MVVDAGERRTPCWGGVLGIEGPVHFGEGRRGHSWLWVSGFPHYVVNVEPQTRWGSQ